LTWALSVLFPSALFFAALFKREGEEASANLFPKLPELPTAKFFNTGLSLGFMN
jgi:hypothetical protein